jgi:hypothetical protein
MKMAIKAVLSLIIIALVLFLGIQLIPVSRTNPSAVTQVKWDSPQTQTLFMRACGDCHSNQTKWTWYSYVAPVSWLVAHDVNEGRSRFNISDLNSNANRQSRLPSEIGRVIQDGRMPLPQYILMHPDAQLTASESQALINGLQTILTNTLASVK